MSNQERDYDIITSQYKCYNDEKVKLDKELSKLQTAKLFYKNNVYNPVKGVYFNQDKEESYKKDHRVKYHGQRNISLFGRKRIY